MDLKDVEKQVVEWNRTTFPRATIDAIFNKFSEEMFEFEEEVINNMPIIFNGRPAEEFVDMIIVFMSARAKLGFTPLTEMIAAKLEINKNRVWGFETSNGDRPRIK